LGVAAAVSRSGLASNVIGMAADKGQATATQNYAYSKIWMSPWVRAMTEMTQNSLDACARNLRIVLLDATALTERDKFKDPLLLTYAQDDGKGMRVGDFILWFQQYGGSGKRSSSGCGGAAPTAGGLGDGNTFTVHGARRTVVRSSNFLRIIQGTSAVHLCAGCGFALPRAQVRGAEGEWSDVTLPCIRDGCGLRCCDGMQAAETCPSEQGGHDMFPALGNLVRRAHAAGEGLAVAAAADPALGLVCTKCWGFHERKPLEEPPTHALFLHGLQLLVEHEPETVRDFRSYWCVNNTLQEARASWLQFVPPSMRKTLQVRACAMDFAEVGLGSLAQEDEEQSAQEAKALSAQSVLQDYPPPAQLSPIWQSPRMQKQGETWAVLSQVLRSQVLSDDETLDKRYLHVLMNSLLVHKLPLYTDQERALVLNLYSTAPPSVYTTSNRGSIEGPLKPLIADLVQELRGEGLRAPESCILLEFEGVVGALGEAGGPPAAESDATSGGGASSSSSSSSSAGAGGIADMLDASSRASDLIKAAAHTSKDTQRAQVAGSLRAALEGSSLSFLADLMRKMGEPSEAAPYMESTVLPALLEHVRGKLPSTQVASMQHALSAEDARAVCLATRFAKAASQLPWEPETHELLASLQRFPAEASKGEGAETWFPPMLVNDRVTVRAPLGLSYGNLSNGVVFVLRLFRSALDMTLAASLKNSRISWRVPKSMQGTKLRVGLLLQSMSAVAYRGSQRFAALTPACAGTCSGSGCSSSGGSGSSGGGGSGSSGGAAILASAGLLHPRSGDEQDSHALACLHLPTQTFCVDAGYILSSPARVALGMAAPPMDAYDESDMCPDACITLLLPLALHEFAHALCDGAEHDEEFAGVLTALTTSAMAERMQDRLVKQAKTIKSELVEQRASAILKLRAAGGQKRARAVIGAVDASSSAGGGGGGKKARTS
jgi:hypothetical protein